MSKKITITKDGPYKVTGNVPLASISIETDADGKSVAWKKGPPIETHGETYFLCRCGKSDKKPFCDGSHATSHFHGREKANRPPYLENAERSEGPLVTLLDDENLCGEAKFCDRGPTVWRLAEGSSQAERQMAIEEACSCPTGRLTIIDENGNFLEPQLPQEICPIQDPGEDCRGPLWVRGGLEITGADNEQYETRNRVSLCRCGQSDNQPYCNGSHYECNQMKGLDK